MVASLNYGSAYSVPTMYNLYDPFSGNVDLTPETIESYEITIAYKDFKITYFNNHIDDMIQYESKYDALGSWVGGSFENVDGTSKIDGLEIAYQTEIFNGIFLNTNLYQTL